MEQRGLRSLASLLLTSAICLSSLNQAYYTPDLPKDTPLVGGSAERQQPRVCPRVLSELNVCGSTW